VLQNVNITTNMSEKKEKLKKIAGELRKASKMHASQAERVEKMSALPLKSPLYMKSGMGRVANGSPINLGWGAAAKIATGGLFAADAAGKLGTDRENQGIGERILRTADDWFLLGLGQNIHNYNKKIKKSRKNYKNTQPTTNKTTRKTSKMNLPLNTFPTEGEL
jgi:hypothetical protein